MFCQLRNCKATKKEGNIAAPLFLFIGGEIKEMIRVFLPKKDKPGPFMFFPMENGEKGAFYVAAVMDEEDENWRMEGVKQYVIVAELEPVTLKPRLGEYKAFGVFEGDPLNGEDWYGLPVDDEEWEAHVYELLLTNDFFTKIEEGRAY